MGFSEPRWRSTLNAQARDENYFNSNHLTRIRFIFWETIEAFRIEQCVPSQRLSCVCVSNRNVSSLRWHNNNWFVPLSSIQSHSKCACVCMCEFSFDLVNLSFPPVYCCWAVFWSCVFSLFRFGGSFAFNRIRYPFVLLLSLCVCDNVPTAMNNKGESEKRAIQRHSSGAAAKSKCVFALILALASRHGTGGKLAQCEWELWPSCRIAAAQPYVSLEGNRRSTADVHQRGSPTGI